MSEYVRHSSTQDMPTQYTTYVSIERIYILEKDEITSHQYVKYKLLSSTNQWRTYSMAEKSRQSILLKYIAVV